MNSPDLEFMFQKYILQGKAGSTVLIHLYPWLFFTKTPSAIPSGPFFFYCLPCCSTQLLLQGLL